MADSPSFVEKYFGHLKKQKLSETLKQNFEWKEGNRGLCFARGFGVGIGGVMAYDAVSRDMTADGQERSGLVRLVEFIVGGGLAAGSVLASRGK